MSTRSLHLQADGYGENRDGERSLLILKKINEWILNEHKEPASSSGWIRGEP